jgi:membrane protein implicated in regulation of membrane protease activity
VINPNIYYLGIIVLAAIALGGTYLHILPDSSAFVAIVSFLIGHGVTAVATQNVLIEERRKAQSQQSSQS